MPDTRTEIVPKMHDYTKTCICTVIKDEQEYLDEWIKYHLDLGIDHIFIFEDIDSGSHREITNKYGERVSLDNPFVVLNKSEQKTALELKQTHKWNIQHLYFRNLIPYIKNSHQYDWCFVIDGDEFITLENPNSKLQNMLPLYDEYDAVVMKWKCYGASGHVQKPDYSKGGVIDTYTNEIDGVVSDNSNSFMKTCYNLNTYKSEFFFNQHHPSDKSNWCNTDFEKDLFNTTYKNIYIRHYITKSWEEYEWKLNKRGFPWGGKRNIDFFFKANPDMLYLKDSLIKDLKKETLVVLPYKQSGSQGNEIRLALNGWKKFCQFKYHFVVIGEFDEQLKREYPWVEWIYLPSKPKKEGQYNPHLDILNKFEWISQKYSDKYDGFIWMVDDNYAIKPFTLEDITTIYYLNHSFSGQEFTPTFYWNHDKWKTRQLLDREGLPHINYTIHYPCYFEFNKLKTIWDKFNMREESYVLEDIYFNYFSHPEPLQVNCIRLGIWSKRDFDEKFQNAVSDPNIKFVCNSVEGWSKELEEAIEKIVKGVLFNKTDILPADNYFKENKIHKLHLGCGSAFLNGWLNTDNDSYKLNPNILYLDVSKRFEFKDDSFDYIYSEHLFEHLTYSEANNMLRECYRVLKPGGIMRISTPNLEFLIDLYLHPEKEINKKYLDFDSKRTKQPNSPIYAISHFHTDWGHKIIYDPKTLTDFLKSAGFKNITRCKIGESLNKELNNIEQHSEHFKRIGSGYDFNSVQTMVFEAEK